MIPESFIQELLNRTDIVEVVGRFVQLKKGGANYLGLCPFHSEKSPSFTVSPTKQFYHCFGCGAHGSAIGFLMEFAGQSYVEAIRDLAQQQGLPVPEEQRNAPLAAPRARPAAQTKPLLDLMQQACDHYRRSLRQHPRAIDYLKRRGLTGEIAARFALGYAPSAWEGLREAFPRYDDAALVECGLIIEKDDAAPGMRTRYDRFRDRIMFPIRNLKGQIIGFGGRVIDQGEPKYLNSPETPLFQKGLELYGLFEARVAIREAGYVLVTEGYMDVVALAQMGFPAAVATLGTACTTTHVQKLLRQTDRVIFSFDGDSAGRRAARRALEAALAHVGDDKIIQFLFLPTEHDPDSFVRAHGHDAFVQYMRDAMPLSDFFLQQVAEGQNLQSAEGRAHALFLARPLLQEMKPSALRLQLLAALARMTQTERGEIEALCGFARAQPAARKSPARVARAAPVGLERQILRLLLMHPVLLEEFDVPSLEAVLRQAPDGGQTLERLIECIHALGALPQFAALAERLRDEGAVFENLIGEVLQHAEEDLGMARFELRGALRQSRLQALKAEANALVAAGLSDPAAQARWRENMNEQQRVQKELLEERPSGE